MNLDDYSLVKLETMGFTDKGTFSVEHESNYLLVTTFQYKPLAYT